MLEIKDNGEFLDIFINGKKIGLASRSRPLAHIVRGVHYLIAEHAPDIDFEEVENKVREVLKNER